MGHGWQGLDWSMTLPAHPTLSQPTLSQLRLFVAVAEAGSFSGAAADLGMSQSSLSEAVASLERALGQPLLRRSAGGAALTGAGQRAVLHARGALLAVSDLQLALNVPAALSGRLRIATYRSLGMHLLPAVLAHLRRGHPALELQVLDAEKGGHGGGLVQSGRADVGLIELFAQQPLLSWPLLRDEYRLIAPAGVGKAAPRWEKLGWEDLQREHFILPPGDSSCHQRIRRHFADHGVTLGSVSEVSEDEVILRMVQHGLGLSVMPGLASEPLPAGLLALPLPDPLVRTLGVAVRPERAGLPHIRAFLDAVQAHFGPAANALQAVSG